MSESKLKLLVPFDLVEPFRQTLGDLVDVVGANCRNEKDLVNAVPDVDLLMGDVDIPVPGNVIRAGTKLKAIVCVSQGVDFVDLKTATEKGVLVTNVPDFCVVAVAEHALGLMLAIARNTVKAHLAAVSGNWNRRGEFKGVELHGKTLGIIGIGRIGRDLASKAKGLGMNVIAYHPHPSTKENVARELGISLTEDLGILLKESDVVSIHIPLKDSTRQMIGEKELRMMKKSAFVVNCSRGAVIDEKALTRALQEEWIAGAALDVMESEPPNVDNALLSLDNVIVTPHIGWNTKEADVKLIEVVRQEIARIVKGEQPDNLVNKEVLR